MIKNWLMQPLQKQVWENLQNKFRKSMICLITFNMKKRTYHLSQILRLKKQLRIGESRMRQSMICLVSLKLKRLWLSPRRKTYRLWFAFPFWRRIPSHERTKVYTIYGRDDTTIYIFYSWSIAYLQRMFKYKAW